MKIEPGDLCRVLPGGFHGYNDCTCLDDRFVVVSHQETPYGCPPPAWKLKEPAPCRNGDLACVWAQEKFLQPIRKFPELAEEPSEARKTELDEAKWMVEKA